MLPQQQRVLRAGLQEPRQHRAGQQAGEAGEDGPLRAGYAAPGGHLSVVWVIRLTVGGRVCGLLLFLCPS